MTNKEQRKQEIIHGMCMTYRHDYGLRLTEKERHNMSVMSGMTETEQKALFMTMTQIFDHHIEPILRERDELMNGERVVFPKNTGHAEAMILLGEKYLESNK